MSSKTVSESSNVRFQRTMKKNQYTTPSVLIVMMETGRMISLSRVNEEGTAAGFSNETGSVEEAAVKDNKSI